jgi:glycosyltransferase involved in cell wall biosynthesis
MRIFYLSHGITYPADSGGKIRIHELLKALSKNHEIFQLSVHPGKVEGRLRMMPFEKRINRNYSEYVLTNPFLIGSAVLAEKLGTKQEFILNNLMPLLETKKIRAEIAKADVLMVGAPWMTGWLHKRAPRKPLFFLTSDLAYAFYKTLLSGRALKKVFAHERRACTRSHKIYVVSDAEADAFAKLYELPKNKVTLLPNGANISSFARADEQQKARLKQELGLAGKKLVVYIGGRHIPAQTAVKMLLEIAAQTPNAHFAVIGGAGDGFKNTHNVTFLGHIPDTDKREKWLPAGDIAINPTTIGPGSNVKLFEYLAAGLPVVSTAYGLRGSTFKPGKDVLTADSVNEFAKIIATLLSDNALRAKLAQAGYESVKRYDWAALAQIIERDLKALKHGSI